MYKTDQFETVVELEGLPAPALGVPFPIVVGYDFGLLLTYEAEGEPNSHPQLDPRGTRSHAQGPTVVVRFKYAAAHMFGHPDENALHNHPLYERGLKNYEIAEVINSAWAREIAANRQAGASLRHFFIAFHDSCLECVAESFSVTLTWKEHTFETLAQLVRDIEA